jgi:exonuclease III
VKIATWNLDRPKLAKTPSSRNAEMVKHLEREDADLLILTETNSAIDLQKTYKASLPSLNLLNTGDSNYTQGENRTTIWSKRCLGSSIPTYDPLTSVCASIQTSRGEGLNVYGTVIGPLGNRRKSFMEHLEKQIADWERICKSGAICIAGDFNLSFCDNYYYTKALICSFFKRQGITVLTSKVENNIDHIGISDSFLKAAKFVPNPVWNLDKNEARPRLSDHIGVSVTINFD